MVAHSLSGQRPGRKEQVVANQYSKHVRSTSKTPVTEEFLGKKQVENNTGGFVFEITPWQRLDRFLAAGSDSNTFYVGAKKLTRDNAKNVLKCIGEDGPRVVARTAEISSAGRAPSNDPAIFVLALCLSDGDEATKKVARATIPEICRIGTHLFTLLEDLKNLEVKWGRGQRNAIANWYTKKDPEKLAHQLVKYQSRNGWSHSDSLRLSHAKTLSVQHNKLFRWSRGHMFSDRVFEEGKKPVFKPIAGALESFLKETPADAALRLVWAFEKSKVAASEGEVVKLIRDYGLPREAIMTNFLKSPAVWEALLDNGGRGMPFTALIRNLAVMTNIGLIGPLSEGSKKVVGYLKDAERVRESLIHPLNVTNSLKQYQMGHGDKGSLEWRPDQNVLGALEEAFYAAFKNVVPTGKRRFIALDVSGSMASGQVSQSIRMTPRECSGILSMVTVRTEDQVFTAGFSGGPSGRSNGYGQSRESRLYPLPLTKSMNLKAVMKTISDLPFDSTDCSLPMRYALEKQMKVDVFEVYTDNEVNTGTHPFKALQDYREKTGIPAKLVVYGMTTTEMSIADPSDSGSLDVAGVDSATPGLVGDWIRG